MTGVDCIDNALQIKDGFWRPPDENMGSVKITKDTKFYPCVNEDACIKPKLGVLVVTCATNLGYEGPLCGACKFDESQRFIRSGAVCAKCERQNDNMLALTVIIVGIILFAIYITAIRSTNSRVGEYGGIIRRQLFSYIQVNDSFVLLCAPLEISLSLAHTHIHTPLLYASHVLERCLASSESSRHGAHRSSIRRSARAHALPAVP